MIVWLSAFRSTDPLNCETQATLRLYDQMLDVGFQPDAITYTLLIKVAQTSRYSLGGQSRRYSRIHHTSSQSCTSLQPNVPPKPAASNVLVQAYTMLNRVEEAIRAFEALDSDPYAVDLTALSAYINALARAGRMEAALRVLVRSDEAASQAGASLSILTQCAGPANLFTDCLLARLQEVHAPKACQKCSRTGCTAHGACAAPSGFLPTARPCLTSML